MWAYKVRSSDIGSRLVSWTEPSLASHGAILKILTANVDCLHKPNNAPVNTC